MTTRRKRRGVETVPIYANVVPETRTVIDQVAAATGARKNVVIEQIMKHVELDERGVPVWWELEVAELPESDQQELPLTG